MLGTEASTIHLDENAVELRGRPTALRQAAANGWCPSLPSADTWGGSRRGNHMRTMEDDDESWPRAGPGRSAFYRRRSAA